MAVSPAVQSALVQLRRRGVGAGALEQPEATIVGARGACARIEGDRSVAKRVGLRELRAGVLEVEQVRLHLFAFWVVNRLNERSRLIGLVIDRLLVKIAEVATGYPQFRIVSAGRDDLVCVPAKHSEPVGPCLADQAHQRPQASGHQPKAGGRVR